MTPTTVSESFINWMTSQGFGSFGTDIYLNQLPSNAGDNAFLVITSGGDVTRTLVTAQNVKRYAVAVTCRNVLGSEVEHKLFELETLVNTRGALELDGFELFSIESSMADDGDRDAENRRLSSLIVTIEIYKSYVS